MVLILPALAEILQSLQEGLKGAVDENEPFTLSFLYLVTSSVMSIIES